MKRSETKRKNIFLVSQNEGKRKRNGLCFASKRKKYKQKWDTLPLPHHHYLATTTLPPLPCYHYPNTTNPPPLTHHHYPTTITPPPLHTTAAEPPKIVAAPQQAECHLCISCILISRSRGSKWNSATTLLIRSGLCKIPESFMSLLLFRVRS